MRYTKDQNIMRVYRHRTESSACYMATERDVRCSDGWSDQRCQSLWEDSWTLDYPESWSIHSLRKMILIFLQEKAGAGSKGHRYDRWRFCESMWQQAYGIWYRRHRTTDFQYKGFRVHGGIPPQGQKACETLQRWKIVAVQTVCRWLSQIHI